MNRTLLGVLEASSRLGLAAPAAGPGRPDRWRFFSGAREQESPAP
jgi:hypothetical protein